jgi:Chaperone of endosialidase
MGLFDIFSTQPAQNAAAAQTAGIQAGYSDLSNLFGQGQTALNTNYAQGLVPFQQNYANTQQGTTALGNALGLNGPGGNAAATAAFWNNPAIQSTLDVGSQNVMRNAQASGAGNMSGAEAAALQNFGQQTASQGWNNYVNSLQPYLGASNAAATGIGNLYSGLGNQLNANLMGQGNAAYGAQTSIGNANANADLAAYNASGNMWGALLGAGKLGASAMPSLMALSDVRAKDDIEPIGKLADGQNIYRFHYKGDDTPQIGLMAQEVEQVAPEAVKEFGGVKFVDYARATDYASRLMKMAA